MVNLYHCAALLIIYIEVSSETLSSICLIVYDPCLAFDCFDYPLTLYSGLGIASFLD